MNDIKKKRPTIKDIAKESGYSKTAVSFAFNEPSRLSSEAVKKILETANSLGYFPNPLARNLSLQKHFSIGFLLPQNINHTMNNPYILKVIEGISKVCESENYTLTIIPPLRSSIEEAVKSAAVDGLITMGMGLENKIVEILDKRNIPLVAIDGNPSQNIPSVNIDDERASHDIMCEVLKRGHRNITIVSLSEDLFTDKISNIKTVPLLRRQGYERALKEYGLSLTDERISILLSECTFEDGVNLYSQIISQQPSVSCVVTMSDIVAIGILYKLRVEKIDVPATLSVVGFDNLLESKLISPRLTTVDQPGLDKGIFASNLLFDYIKGKIENTTRIEVPYKVIIRESLGEFNA
ncbi:MAG: LacI family DNA-binding transcriptional regulator [Spirochaetaceae bacterium]|nr:LacI family DNA-binding transcriptional regulator [Spirochaetaceae bacterium]